MMCYMQVVSNRGQLISYSRWLRLWRNGWIYSVFKQRSGNPNRHLRVHNRPLYHARFSLLCKPFTPYFPPFDRYRFIKRWKQSTASSLDWAEPSRAMSRTLKSWKYCMDSNRDIYCWNLLFVLLLGFWINFLPSLIFKLSPIFSKNSDKN